MRQTVEKPVKKNILLKRILLSLGILIFIRMGTFLPIPVSYTHLTLPTNREV